MRAYLRGPEPTRPNMQQSPTDNHCVVIIWQHRHMPAPAQYAPKLSSPVVGTSGNRTQNCTACTVINPTNGTKPEGGNTVCNRVGKGATGRRRRDSEALLLSAPEYFLEMSHTRKRKCDDFENPPPVAPPASGDPGGASLSPELISTAADDYALLSIVGEGTFAVVHKARRRSDAALVAVKRLKCLDQAAARIRDEISCLRSLSGCAHTVQLLDCHRADGTWDIVTPYFEHVDFGDALAAGRFTPEHTLLYTRALFEALGHIHDRASSTPTADLSPC